jgi:hypothetical protein
MRSVLAGAAACVLVACGADQVAGIQGSGSPVASGVTSVGPISGFGSVFLGGIEYDTSGAQIHVDDQSGTESQLSVGHVITLKGTVNDDGKTGKATDIAFVSDLRGRVTAIDVANRTFTVLCQTVRVDDSTLFDDDIQPVALAGMQLGVVVQVSGFANAAGELIASRVELAQPAAGLQVKGTVKALDAVAHTFRINALTVDYSGVAPSGTLANGNDVVVRGSVFALSRALLATQVQIVGAPTAAANDRGQISGVVTTFTSASDFVVGEQRVLTDASTQLVLHGATLGVNARVDVQGTFNAAGALVARKVEVKPKTLSLVRGLVDSVSSATASVTVLGVSVAVTSTTSLEDKSSQHVRFFSLADVRTGDYVEVRGTPNDAGTGLVATLVERDKPETRSYVQGLVRAVNDPNFTVLNVTVATDAQTRFIGLGAPTQAAAAQFFSQALNQNVQVRGTVVGSVLLADKVQIRP